MQVRRFIVESNICRLTIGVSDRINRILNEISLTSLEVRVIFVCILVFVMEITICRVQ